MAPFEVTEISPGRYRMRGELDMASAETLLDAMRPIATADRPIALDLEELTFIDSSGIRAVVDLASSMNGAGPLVLSNVPASVQRVLDIAGLETLPGIRVEHDLEVASDGG